MFSLCSSCQKSFPILAQDLEFYKKISPVIAGKTYFLPSPQRCPECRLQRRLSWRNETNLYRRKSDFTGKDIISIYSPDKPYRVYELSHYDQMDLMSYGMDIDPVQAVFPQMAAFFKQMPVQALINIGENEASEYCNYSYQCKNCYLCFWGDWGEDSLYNYGFWKLKDCVDNYWLFEGELAYENVNVYVSFNSKYVYNSENITDCAFVANCRSLQHCMFCVNLQHHEYCLFNKQYSKEEYFEKIKAYDLGSFSTIEKLQKEFAAFAEKFPLKNLNNIQIENVTGDLNKNAKNCYKCYHMVDAEDCAYGIDHIKAKDVYDSYGSGEIEQCYEVLCTGVGTQRAYFSFDIYTSYNVIYCISCRNCKDCFGCVGLRHKQYCIFNKQYSQEDYEKYLGEILTTMTNTHEWGEFFPAWMSPFGYNESTAQEYFPLSKNEALAKEYRWSEYEAPKPEADQVIEAKDLPDHISEVDDTILTKAIRCASSGRLFRLTKQELAFYRAHTIPLPRCHSDIRRQKRAHFKNPRAIRETTCAHCHENIETSVGDENNRQIFCEKCYRETN